MVRGGKESCTIDPVPWYLVSGFGAHIKATPRVLIVQRHGRTEEIPLAAVRHLLVMGGHTLHTSAISRSFLQDLLSLSSRQMENLSGS